MCAEGVYSVNSRLEVELLKAPTCKLFAFQLLFKLLLNLICLSVFELKTAFIRKIFLLFSVEIGKKKMFIGR